MYIMVLSEWQSTSVLPNHEANGKFDFYFKNKTKPGNAHSKIVGGLLLYENPKI